MNKLLIICITAISTAQAMDAPMSRPRTLSPLQKLQAGLKIVVGDKPLSLRTFTRKRHNVMDTSTDDMAIARFLDALQRARNNTEVYNAIVRALEPGQIRQHPRLKSILGQVACQTPLPSPLSGQVARALQKAGLKKNHEFNRIEVIK